MMKLATLNRDFWRCVESATRALPKKLDSDILSITVPQYARKPERTPEWNGFDTAIPSHFSKIIYKIGKQGKAIKEAICVQLQNKNFDESKELDSQPPAYYPVLYPWAKCPSEIRGSFPAPEAKTNGLFDAMDKQLYKVSGQPSSLKCRKFFKPYDDSLIGEDQNLISSALRLLQQNNDVVSETLERLDFQLQSTPPAKPIVRTCPPGSFHLI
jgi:hypothetical protein